MILLRGLGSSLVAAVLAAAPSAALVAPQSPGAGAWTRFRVGGVTAAFPCRPEPAPGDRSLAATFATEAKHIASYQCSADRIHTSVIVVAPLREGAEVKDACHDLLTRLGAATLMKAPGVLISEIEVGSSDADGTARMTAVRGDVTIAYESRGWRSGSGVTIITTLRRSGDTMAQQSSQRVFESVKRQKPAAEAGTIPGGTGGDPQIPPLLPAPPDGEPPRP